MDRSIINSIVGRTIKEMRVMSFYINRKLICNIIALYVKIDTGIWYKFVTSDGRNTIEVVDGEPLEIMLEEIEDEFAYPIKTVHLHYNNKKIEKIMEYQYKNQTDELSGFYIKLDHGGGFSFFEEGNCLRIFDGIKIDDEYSLV